MTQSQDEDDKQHDPTERRLQQAREKGEVAKSQDVITAAAYAGFLIAAVAIGPQALRNAGSGAARFLDHAWGNDGLVVAPDRLAAFGPFLMAFLIVPGLAALLAVVAQRALVFVPDRIQPKLSRISPLQGAKNRFGRSGLFDFLKSAAKLGILGVALWLWLAARLDRVLLSMQASPGQSVVVMLQMIVEFLMVVTLIAATIGGIDLLWQKAEHRRRNRMSRQDLIEEQKESEGDPQTKAQRRQRGMDIATNRMLADVAKADVVIVNPLHYAVALRWERGSGRAPVCVARGVDEIAARIRERAALANVPLHRDPPTARALYASVDIGQEILPEHYRAVAAAIRFAVRLRKQARTKGLSR